VSAEDRSAGSSLAPVIEWSDGKLSVDLQDHWMAAVQIAVKNWKAAGIDAALNAADPGGSFDRMLLTLRDGATTTDPDVYFGALLPGNPLNTSGVNDPKLTEIGSWTASFSSDSCRFDVESFAKGSPSGQGHPGSRASPHRAKRSRRLRAHAATPGG